MTDIQKQLEKKEKDLGEDFANAVLEVISTHSDVAIEKLKSVVYSLLHQAQLDMLEVVERKIIEEIGDYKSMPMLGATNEEEYRECIGWVKCLKHLLALIQESTKEKT